MRIHRVTLVLVALAGPFAARAAVIDFNDLQGEDRGGFMAYGEAFTTQGFDFSGTSFITITDHNPFPGFYNVKDDPNLTEDFYGQTVTMRRHDGMAFDLLGLDVANAIDKSLKVGGSAIAFKGFRKDGTTTERAFVSDGSTNDWQAVSLPGFTDLDRFTWVQSFPGVQLDNLRTGAAPVPEPATFGALAVGVTGALRRRRR